MWNLDWDQRVGERGQLFPTTLSQLLSLLLSADVSPSGENICIQSTDMFFHNNQICLSFVYIVTLKGLKGRAFFRWKATQAHNMDLLDQFRMSNGVNERLAS